MQIGVDVMGGDNAPRSILDGAIAALDGLEPDDRLRHRVAGSRDPRRLLTLFAPSPIMPRDG